MEAATTFTQITRGRAEELVRDLVVSGELERTRAQEWIEDLVKRSREASETLVSSISAEVERQLADRGLKNLDLDDLAQRVAGILEHAGTVGRNVTMPRVWARGTGGATATTAPAKSSGKKKDGTPKTSTKPGKKPESKKVGTKKAEHKKADSKETEPTTVLPEHSHEHTAGHSHEHTTEDRTEPLDHGVTT
jgi:polyhydroxyalkanoate synthesis regulator phasin